MEGRPEAEPREPYLGDPGRLAALARTGLLDSPAEPSFDQLARLAAKVLRTPVALVSLVDDRRQFFKSCYGLHEPWAGRRGTPLTHSFCQHVVASREPLVIDDARLDPMVKDNLAVTEIGVIAYLGIPLVVEGEVIGSFCAIDSRPRAWTPQDVEMLGDLAVAVVTEIKLRAQLERAARQRAEAEEERRKTHVTLSSIGDAVIATDAGGLVTFLNPVAEALSGWLEADARGRPVGEVFRIVNAATRLPVADPVAAVLATGSPAELEDQTVLIASDGREWPIEDSAAPIPAPDGSVAGCVLVFRDVSARRSQGIELEDTRKRLESMLSVGHIGTWEYDLASGIVTADANLARIYGVDTPGPMAGPIALYFDIIHPDDHAAIMAAVQEAIDSTDHYEAEYRLVMPDRSTRWVVARGRVERDASGKAVKLPGVVVDITDQKRAEAERQRLVDQLRDADARKDEFLAMLAHELRNPLGVISSGVQLAAAEEKPGVLAELREVIQHQVGHITHLIEDLLDVSRIAQGKVELKRRTVDLAAVVGRAMAAVRPLADEKRHELIASLPDRPVRFVADPTRAEQILGNLLTNAAKYSPPGGSIRLSAGVEDGQVVFRVRDLGDGIPADMLPKIFNLFTQVDATADRSRGGLGIGLTLVKNLAEMHGGTVAAASEGRGKGSEFTVRIPVGEPEPEREPGPRPEARPTQARRGDGLVLIVDDNADTVRLTARMLRLRGYRVEIAHDGNEGIELARLHRPDAILLDIGLPGRNGYEVAEQLRREDCGKDACLIAVSGYGEVKARERSREAGFDHHLTKPVDFDELHALLAAPPA
jgi:PAS domain S-box-containing protein